MNRELIGILAKLDLTQEDVAGWINRSRQTVIQKIKNGTFNQAEQTAIVNQLRQYDRDIDMNLFFLNW